LRTELTARPAAPYRRSAPKDPGQGICQASDREAEITEGRLLAGSWNTARVSLALAR